MLVSSANFASPAYGLSHYLATKGGVIGLTKGFATDLGRLGIRVNAVCPGATDTPMLRGRASADYLDTRAKSALLGRLGRPEDQAQCIGFLLSEQSSWITGQTFYVNGGSAMP